MKNSVGYLMAGTAIALLLPSPAFAQASSSSDAPATAEDVQAPASPRENPGDIVVTGSHIQGANPTGLLPVTNMDEDEVAATGADTGDDLFREVAQAGDVGFNESRMSGNLTDSRGDVASINIRSLGTGNTLVLLNGRRMVKHPGTQVENLVRVQTANINEIPVSAIRRVEILRDGAAAIYGADAVAGVVNIVLDKRYEGLKLTARYGFSEDTDHYRLSSSFKWGRSFNDGRTNLTLFGSYYKASPMRADERDYSASSDQRPRVEGTPFEGDTNFDLRSNTNPWAWLVLVNPRTVRQGTTALTNSSGQFHIVPVQNGCSGSSVIAGGNCLKTGLQSATTDRNLYWNENDQRWLLGGRERYNLYSTLEHEFSENLEGFAEFNYYRADYQGQRNRVGTTSTSMIRIPASNYWNPFGPLTMPDGSPNPNRLPGLTLATVPAEGLDVYLRTYTPVDVGPRPYTVKDENYRVVAGLRGRFGRFDWESGFVYSEAHKKDISHAEISKTLFQQALARTTPDAYNPFNGSSATDPSGPDALPSEDLTSFLVSNTRASKSSLASWDARLSTPDLFQLPAGDVGIALGTEWRRETYADDRGDRINGTIKFEDMFGRTDGNSDSDIMGSQPLPNTAANRNVISAYAELAIPLVSPEMGMPLIRAIDVQLAGRVERYSDFGWIAKPKVAASWEIAPRLLVRGSWSQSFRAPDLAQVSNADSQASSGYQDYYRCEADKRAGRIPDFGVCARATTLTNYRANADLLAEDAETFSYGVVFQPKLPSGWGRLTLMLDYWRVHQINAIGLFGAGNHIALDYLLRLRGSSNPAVIRDEVTPEQLVTFAGTGLEPAGTIIEVFDRFMNLQPETIEGLDITARYDVRGTPIGNISVRLNAAHLLKYQQEPSAMAQELLDAQASGEIDSQFLVPGTGDLLRQNGRPRWRVTGSLTWRNGPVVAGMSARYISSVEQTGARLADLTLWQVDSWTTVNAYVGYDFKHGAMKGTSVRFGVNNIANKAPPLAAADFGYLGSLHNSIGRHFYAQLSKSF
ncbi:TonB-dependent receptor domain-containing protein [Sphingopyxis granuli]|nr:TonB-dependent receptor [Sphingopyxis granuli]